MTSLKASLLFYVRKHGRNFGSLFYPVMTCQKTRSKTFSWNRRSLGNTALFLCRALGGFHCSQGCVSVDLPTPFRCFTFFTLCCLMLYAFCCAREREREERKKRLISLQIFTSISSITALLTLCLLALFSNWFRMYYESLQWSWMLERWRHIKYASVTVTWSQLFHFLLCNACKEKHSMLYKMKAESWGQQRNVFLVNYYILTFKLITWYNILIVNIHVFTLHIKK